jgi:hypothetical protein
MPSESLNNHINFFLSRFLLPDLHVVFKQLLSLLRREREAPQVVDVDTLLKFEKIQVTTVVFLVCPTVAGRGASLSHGELVIFDAWHGVGRYCGITAQSQ